MNYFKIKHYSKLGIYIIIIFILCNISVYAHHAQYTLKSLKDNKINIHVTWENSDIKDGMGLVYYRLSKDFKTLTIGYEKRLNSNNFADLEYNLSQALPPIRIILKAIGEKELLWSDITDDNEYQYIEHLHSAGIINGRPDGTLGAREKVTRAEFIAMLLRAKDIKPDKSSSNQFIDIVNHWAKNYIKTAISLKILNGFANNTVKPDKSISLAEACTIISKSFSFKTFNKGLYPGLSEGKWYTPYVKNIFETGIIAKNDRVYQNLNEDRAIDRATAIIMISRAISTM